MIVISQAQATVATFDGIRTDIAQASVGHTTDVAFIWGTFNLVPDQLWRASMRPPHGTYNGTTTRGNRDAPNIGLYLGCPGKNSVIMLSDGDLVRPDPTLLEWMKDAGFASDVKVVRDLAELKRFLEARDARLYSCDTYGEALEGLTVTDQETFDAISSKWNVSELTGGLGPSELREPDMFDSKIDASMYHAVGGDFAVLKTCNVEHGGMGVHIARSKVDFALKLAAIRDAVKQDASLSRQLIIQRGVIGESKSFSLFIKPGDSSFQVMGVTDQVVCPITGRDNGNRMHPLTDDVISPLLPMMETLVRNVKAMASHAFGVLMCDYMQTPDGNRFMIDPGLRPSAATSAAMTMHWFFKHTGRWPYVQNTVRLDGDNPRCASWKELCRKVGPTLTDPANMHQNMAGVMPFSISPADGTGRLIIVAPDESRYADVEREVLERLRG